MMIVGFQLVGILKVFHICVISLWLMWTILKSSHKPHFKFEAEGIILRMLISLMLTWFNQPHHIIWLGKQMSPCWFYNYRPKSKIMDNPWGSVNWAKLCDNTQLKWQCWHDCEFRETEAWSHKTNGCFSHRLNTMWKTFYGRAKQYCKPLTLLHLWSLIHAKG